MVHTGKMIQVAVYTETDPKRMKAEGCLKTIIPPPEMTSPSLTEDLDSTLVSPIDSPQRTERALHMESTKERIQNI